MDGDCSFVGNWESSQLTKDTLGRDQITGPNGETIKIYRNYYEEYYDEHELPSGLYQQPSAEEIRRQEEERKLNACKQKDKILLGSGECYECRSYTYPDTDYKSCTYEICDEKSKLLLNGKCEPCADGKKADETGKACILDCPSYTYYSH